MFCRRWIALCGLLPLGFTTISYAAHPLITEDSGTQGRGRNQLEFTAEYAHDHTLDGRVRDHTHSLVWSYGLRDDADFVLALPYQRLRTASDGEVTHAHGLSDIGLDVKWRFYEDGPLSLALKSGASLPSGDEDQGLGTGRRGYSAYLIATLASGHWHWHAHAGYVRNRNSVNERDDLRHFSMAAGHELSERLRIVADIGTTTATDKTVHRHPVFLIFGLIYAVGDNFDIDVGYKKGLTDAENDRAWLAGVTLRF